MLITTPQIWPHFLPSLLHSNPLTRQVPFISGGHSAPWDVSSQNALLSPRSDKIIFCTSQTLLFVSTCSFYPMAHTIFFFSFKEHVFAIISSHTDLSTNSIFRLQSPCGQESYSIYHIQHLD